MKKSMYVLTMYILMLVLIGLFALFSMSACCSDDDGGERKHRRPQLR